MTNQIKLIDHLVYCVHDLDVSIEHFYEAYGLKATIGGKHANQGTRNALINLGNNCYLELLAIDKENKSIARNRWMGIDLLQVDKFTRWAMGSSQIDSLSKSLREYNEILGQSIQGERLKPDGTLLSWKMTVPASHPEVELMPFLIDWSDSVSYPTDGLDQQGQLIELQLLHPEPDKLKPAFIELGIDIPIEKNEEVSIKALIEGPMGRFVI